MARYLVRFLQENMLLLWDHGFLSYDLLLSCLSHPILLRRGKLEQGLRCASPSVLGVSRTRLGSNRSHALPPPNLGRLTMDVVRKAG